MAHRLSFAGLWLFTLVLYLRPNDLLPIGTFPVAKIIGTAALTVFLIEQLTRGRPISVMPKEFKYLLGLIALMLISAPLAIDSTAAFETVAEGFFKVFLIFMLMINVVTSFGRLRRLLVLTTVCGTIIAAGSIQTFLVGQALVEGYRARGFVGGIFGNPNDLALALNMLVPLGVELALTSRTGVFKLFYWGCVASMIGAVFVSFSRSGFLTLLAIAAYSLVSLGRRYRSAKMAILTVGLAVLMFAPEGYGTRVLSMFEQSLDPVGSISARRAVFTRSLEAVGLNPKAWLFGVGVNNFHIVSIHEAVNHNAYLQVFTEVGLPAMVVYLMFLFGVLKRTGQIARVQSETGDAKTLSVTAAAVQGSLIAYAVGSFFASVAYQWYLYYPAGYAVCLEQIAVAERDRDHLAEVRSNREST